MRVVIDGTTEAGRRLLRGVMRYARAHTTWALLVEMEPARRKGADWAVDEAVIYASHDAALLAWIRTRDIPIVSCMAHHEPLGLPTVRSDDYAVGAMAAKYFIERGFGNFIFDSTGDVSPAAQLRFKGFADAVAAMGFKAEQHVPETVGTWINWYDHLTERLAAMPKPVALFFSHDTIARGGADLIAASGLAVPEQVAILGVDDDQLQCEISRPPLSSIAVPYADIGYQAAAVLHSILRGKVPATMSGPVLFKPTGVVTRQSTDIIAFDEPRLAEALRYMREHACDPCSVEDVLSHVLVSRRWLESQFKKRFGRSPHDEITRIRMEHAKRLLHDPHLSLKWIAERAGYGHVQNFVSIFRRTSGLTPAAYRRSLQNPTTTTPLEAVSNT